MNLNIISVHKCLLLAESSHKLRLNNSIILRFYMVKENKLVKYFGVELASIAWVVSMIPFVSTDGKLFHSIVLICVLLGFVGIGIHFILNADAIFRNKYFDK